MTRLPFKAHHKNKILSEMQDIVMCNISYKLYKKHSLIFCSVGAEGKEICRSNSL